MCCFCCCQSVRPSKKPNNLQGRLLKLKLNVACVRVRVLPDDPFGSAHHHSSKRSLLDDEHRERKQRLEY